jgi:phosphoglycerate dehydrogenase-like enzyme
MPDSPKTLLLEPLHPDAERILEENGGFARVSARDAATVVREGAHAEAIINRAVSPLTREILYGCPNLRCVARCGAGYDNVDVQAATERGIPVFYTPGANVQSVAEHALMLMLIAARQAPWLDRQVKEGRWDARHAVVGRELSGKFLGILGLGRIGRRVAELGAALGMEAGYWSRNARDSRFEFIEREDLIARSDVLSLHVALTAETRGLMNAERLSRMKPGALLINTGRGALIDERALLDALRNGPLAAAGLDVMADEPPPPDHPLFRLSNVVITPHSAALTDHAFRAMGVVAAENVVRVLNGFPPDPACVANAVELGLSGRSS